MPGEEGKHHRLTSSAFIKVNGEIVVLFTLLTQDISRTKAVKGTGVRKGVSGDRAAGTRRGLKVHT